MKKTIVPHLTGVCWLLAATAQALSAASGNEPNKTSKEEVVREITLPSPVREYTTGVDNPLKITSAEELAKALPNQEQLAKQVDFTKEQCLFFAWKGSGRDQLSFKIEEGKKGPVVVFHYWVGQTDDLRPHAHLYVLAKNATWRFGDERAEGVKEYLTEDGKLKETLRLDVGHNFGLTGRSIGNTWVIEPSGAWTMTATDAKEPTAKGKLTAQQLAALAQHLATQNFNNLPANLGSAATPDRGGDYVAITFGKKGTTFDDSLAEGPPKAGDAKVDDWSHFVALKLVLQDLLRETKPEPKKDK